MTKCAICESEHDGPCAVVAGDFIPLNEKAVMKDGTIEVKIIAPGQGSSGWYPRETLRRDGPKVFKMGTPMFWDHPSRTEERDRPERSLKDMAGALMTSAVYHEQHADGPGLYARARVFSGFQSAVDEMAPHIGVSIRGFGKPEAMTEDGVTHKDAIAALTSASSVDFVTAAGAGGKVRQLFESAHGGNFRKASATAEEDNMAKIRFLGETIREENGKFCLYDGDTKGKCYDSAGEAEAASKTSESARRVVKFIGETIRQEGDKFVLYDGDKKVGEFASEIEAVAAANAAGIDPTVDKGGAPAPAANPMGGDMGGAPAGGTQPVVTHVVHQESRTLKEVSDKLARLTEVTVLREARDFTVTALARVRLPQIVKDRVVRECVTALPIKDGSLDEAAFAKIVTEKVKAEADYVARLTGSGTVRDAGGASADDAKAALAESTAIEAQLTRTFAAIGMGEKAAKIAASGRTN